MKNSFLNKLKGSLLIVGLIAVLVLAACGSSDDSSGADSDGGDGETYSIDFSYVSNEDSPQHKGQAKFKELVEEKSNGQIEVELYPNGQLYSSEAEAYEAVQTGNIEMTMGGTAALAGIDGNFSLLELPYLFPDVATAHEALDGDLGDALFEGLLDQGLKGVAYGEAGMKLITNNQRPLETIEDFNGLLVRTQENPIHVKTYEKLGANPSPYAFGEVYSALQQNVFHAQDNPPVNIIDMKFYEVQDYLTISEHSYTGLAVVINNDFFESLPEDLQDVILEAGKEAYDYQREEAAKVNDEGLAELEEHMEVDTISDELREEIIEKTDSLYDEFEEEVGKELMDLARSYR